MKPSALSSLFGRLEIVSAMTHRCEAGWSWQSVPERFPHFNLWMIHGGCGEMAVGRERIELSPGRVCLLRPRTNLVATHDPKNRLIVTAIHFHFLDRNRRRWRPRVEWLPPVSKRIADAKLFEALCRRIVRLDALPGGRSEAEAYLTAILLGLRAAAAEEAAVPQSLADVERLIREQPGDVPPIAELAERSGLTPEHFSRTFRKTFGKSPQTLLIESRIARACSLLAGNRLSVAQVAELLGYRDVFFFSRQFKARTGHAPAQWRRDAAAD